FHEVSTMSLSASRLSTSKLFRGGIFGRKMLNEKRLPRFLPNVEALEDRVVPDTKVVMAAPVANSDWADTDGSNPVAVAVLANDSLSAVPSTVAVVSALAHGKAVVNSATGEITYTANAGFTGSDTFQYTVKDIRGLTSAPAK